MRNKVVKHVLVPGALGLILVFQTQTTYAQENENPIDTGLVSVETQKEATIINNAVDTKENKGQVEDKKEDEKETEGYCMIDDESDKENQCNKDDPYKDKDTVEDEDSFRYKHPYEDKDHNKNFQDHSIEAENDGSYKFEKGKELTQEEIDKEFEEYKKNASSFAKIQEWIPKLKDMNLLGLEDDEESSFYIVEFRDKDDKEITVRSVVGFDSYIDENGKVVVHELGEDKIYYVGTQRKSYNGSIYRPPVYKVVNFLSSDKGNNIIRYNGSYAKKCLDENGKVYYEFYEGGNLIKNDNETNFEKMGKILEDIPNGFTRELGYIDHEIRHRAYLVALVNNYLVKNEPDMSLEDRKNIVDYIYRFGLDGKFENNGYVDVSPLGYASKNEDGSYKYRYQVSFNSITSNDIYSSTHLDVYAPTMAKNLKFILNGVQEYIKNKDGSYSYRNKDVNVELGIVNTRDKDTRKLYKEDYYKTYNDKIKEGDVERDNNIYVPESIWNTPDYKHKENIFSIPYYNDLNNRKKLDHKVVEFDKYVDFSGDSVSINEDKYKAGYNGYLDGKTMIRPEEHYRHFRLVNPQNGGPISFIVEFDIDKDQVEKSPNIALGARILSGLNKSNPTAFNFEKYYEDGDKSSSRPGSNILGNGSYQDDKEGKVIEGTLTNSKLSVYSTIYNHPELIKPGTFDVNGFYANAGGAPSEYTGDKYKIGLKVGKNICDFGEYMADLIKKEQRKNPKKTINVKMKTKGATSLDIGIQIANGYGRYGDYRIKTGINEDKLINKLMTLEDIKPVKSDRLVSNNMSVEVKKPDNDYEDITEDYTKTDPKTGNKYVDVSKLEEDTKKVPVPGDGAKNLLSNNTNPGPVGISITIPGTTNADSPRGGVDVTPIGTAKENPDGTWRYEYQISMRGVHSSDHEKTTSDYSIVMPSFVKNVKFTLIGNTASTSDLASELRNRIELGLENYENFLGYEEKLIIDRVKENLRRRGLSDKLSGEQVANILENLEINKIYNKNTKMNIYEWNPDTMKYISGYGDVEDIYKRHLDILNSIPKEVYEIIGKKNNITADEAHKRKINELDQIYKNVLEEIDKQLAKNKIFLKDVYKLSYIGNYELYDIEKNCVCVDYFAPNYEMIFEGYKKYFENAKDKAIKDLDKKYQDKENMDYINARDKIILDYAKNLRKIELTRDSWAGTSRLLHEDKMNDYTDVFGRPLNLITKRGIEYVNGVYMEANMAKLNIYSFSSRGNRGVVGLRVTFDVDDDQVRKTPFIPVDARNVWRCNQEEGGQGSYELECQSMLEYNGSKAYKVLNKETGVEISQDVYDGLYQKEQEKYYRTNYYYVEHPEYITRDMFDIHGLHSEPSVDVTSYTGRWQEIGEDVEPWGDNLRGPTFDYYSIFQPYEKEDVTFILPMNEDFRDIAVVGPCAAQIRKIKEDREISINKEWLNLGGISEIPDEISVVLSDGKNEKTIKLTKDNDFKFTIGAESPLCSYTIKEIEVPGFEHKETNIKYRFVFRDSKTKEEKKTVYLNALNSEGKAERKEISIEELNKLISSGNYRIERPLNNDKIDKIGKDTIILEDGVIIVPHGIEVSTLMTVQLVNERTPEEPPEEPETPPETPPEEPETPPETPPEEPEVPEEVEVEEVEEIQTPKETHGNPKTGVEGVSGMFALMASSLAGLFVTKKK